MHQHTFVVLAYKVSPFLGECLSSLRDQSVVSSIIVANSTPSPFIDQISRSFGYPVHINPESRGIASDWNFGLAQASTPFVTLAHQDDVYDRTYSEKMLKAANERSDNLITFSHYSEMIGGEIRTDTTNLLVKKCLIRASFGLSQMIASPVRKRMLVSFGSPIACPSVMYHRKHLTDFSFSSDLSISVDWGAWIDIALRHGSIAYVNEPLLTHRIHAGSETSTGIADNRRANEDLLLFEKLWPKPLAGLLARVYALSYSGNKTG